EAKISDMKMIMSSFEPNANSILEDIASTKSQIKEAEKHLAELEHADSSCPVCRKQLDAKSKQDIRKEHEETLKEKHSEIKKLEGKKLESDKQLNDCLAQIKTSEEKILELKKKELSFSSYKSSLEKIEVLSKSLLETGEELKKYLNALASLEKSSNKDELNSLEKKKQTVEKLNSLLQKNTELISFKEKQNSLEKKISELGFDEASVLNLRKNVLEAKSYLDNLSRQENSLREFIQEIEQNINSSKKILENIEEAKKSVKEKQFLVEKISLFVNALKETQIQLRSSLLDSINQAMEDIWPRIYPYKDFVSSQIRVVEGDYEIMVKEKSGEWVRVEGILSGGERSAAALTIRIAVSLVLARNLSWLILDEPTHNLDSKAVSELAILFREHLPELVDQIFVITHEKEMEKAATASLYFMQRDKNNEGITEPQLTMND
ncbi:MAG: hypothetical protein Q7K42_00905, partial [Candidatus Diapherotrites archaeon]|nr:hypothetical protein [Candidatus Diapherotrites archaeon]